MVSGPLPSGKSHQDSSQESVPLLHIALSTNVGIGCYLNVRMLSKSRPLHEHQR